MLSFFNGFYAFCFRICKYETNKYYLLPIPGLPTCPVPRKSILVYYYFHS